MKKTHIAALATGFALTASGLFAYNASVHEQKCLSYEKQGTALLNKQLGLADEVLFSFEQVKINPFAALGILPLINQWNIDTKAGAQKVNDWRYAYVGTCGADRHRKFTQSPEFANLFVSLSWKVDLIKNFSF